MAVDSINAISGVTGVPVERVLLTLELNKLDPYQIDALQNKILATKNDQEIKRLQNIQRIIGDFLRLPLQTKDTIKRFLETPNSLAKLRKEFGLK
ncbi:MAG: hypothetical protein HYW50_00885 [Candidatus Diapherotrites archaeon]|nr:hypothetical protein [Candidatus Diapherotrites archaeon]